jgi:peptidoglycan biosynthesis protein MviN/MurJ (putative lipid II flippase)
MLRRKFTEPLLTGAELRGVVKLVLATGLATGVTWSLAAFAEPVGLSTPALGAVGSLLFFATYLVGAWLLDCQELTTLLDPLRRRLQRRR